jgi:hypothetical protein
MIPGLSPHDLLADEDLFVAAVEEAERAEWSTLHRLLARQLEVSHALLRVVMGAIGFPEAKIPEPLVIEDPDHETVEADVAVFVSPGEAAKMFGWVK